MKIESIDDPYTGYIQWLNRLTFVPVRLTIVKRADLVAFNSREGKRLQVIYPDFGDRWATLSETERNESDPDYRYYYGFADDVFFKKRARSRSKTLFIPSSSTLRMEHRPPQNGDILVGEVEPAPSGEGRRFIWWQRVAKQDQTFARVLLGQVSYSRDRLKNKLTSGEGAGIDETLYYAALALHYRDYTYFSDAISRGEMIIVRGESIIMHEWLAQHILPLLPDFLDQCKKRSYHFLTRL